MKYGKGSVCSGGSGGEGNPRPEAEAGDDGGMGVGTMKIKINGNYIRQWFARALRFVEQICNVPY